MFCGGCGSSTTATPASRKRADPRPSDTTIIQPLPPRSTVISVPFWPAGPNEPAAAPAEALRTRYTLQFSTGETVSVRGTGLIGRRPLPQPTETFDHLIQITDPGRSVSKSHLEFGQHDGEFWVNDRFSGNGTVVLQAPASAVRCEPGQRYPVARGSIVEIGDQHFVLR
ncbi:MAG: hypothetical protein JWP54_482 [Cryobacterium sp.]|jgi:pSer/pThr/pTyr-binding forkhead associated (FHA) protein|nr:hypothetical protein [Cryobacterium sp.]